MRIIECGSTEKNSTPCKTRHNWEADRSWSRSFPNQVHAFCDDPLSVHRMRYFDSRSGSNPRSSSVMAFREAVWLSAPLSSASASSSSMYSLFSLFFFFFFGFWGFEAAVEGCNRSCGSYTAPYPFGFSDGCSIRLNCSNPAISTYYIGDFAVRNLTQDAIVVDVQPSCSRSVQAASRFFGPNFALSDRTGVLLRNCTPPPRHSGGNCSAESVLVDDQCGTSYENTTCFLNATTMKDLNSSGCDVFYTSGVAHQTSVLSVDLNTAELAWWLLNPCNCSRDAHSELVHGTSPSGCRCKCRGGFHGDGYVNGTGCQPGRSLLGICCFLMLCSLFCSLYHGFVLIKFFFFLQIFDNTRFPLLKSS